MRRKFQLIVSDTDYVRAHPFLEADLKSLVGKSGIQDDFHPKLQQRLKWLQDTRRNCVLRKQWFERLKGTTELYVIRFNRFQKNVRILFAFVNENNREYAVLLHAFEEKNGKKKGPYSYTQAIEVAKKRLEEVTRCEG